MPAPTIHAPWLRLDLQQMLIEIATPLGLCKKATQTPEKLTTLELANLLVQSPISDTIVQPILIKIPQEVTQAAQVLRSLAPESLHCALQPHLRPPKYCGGANGQTNGETTSPTTRKIHHGVTNTIW